MKKIVRMENVSEAVARPGHRQHGRRGLLCDITLDIDRGERIGLIGAPGAGKSALLNLIAGHVRPAAGLILCNDRRVTGPGPDRAVVFPNHALLPWLTCFDNVYLAVERVFGAKEGKAKLKQRTHDALARLALTQAEAWFPHEIPIDMKQRVGLARALAMQPLILLLDDPFAMLDAPERARLQDELATILGETGMTLVLATRDADEALLLCDRVVLLSGGRTLASDILDVKLERPRDRQMLATAPAFVAARAAITSFVLRDERRHAA